MIAREIENQNNNLRASRANSSGFGSKKRRDESPEGLKLSGSSVTMVVGVEALTEIGEKSRWRGRTRRNDSVSWRSLLTGPLCPGVERHTIPERGKRSTGLSAGFDPPGVPSATGIAAVEGPNRENDHDSFPLDARGAPVNALGGQKPERPKLHLNFNRAPRSPIPTSPLEARARRQVGEIAALTEALNGARERIEFLEGQLTGSDQTINELMCMLGRADREAFAERRAVEIRAERAEAIVHGVIREDQGRCFAMGERVAEYAGVPA